MTSLHNLQTRLADLLTKAMMGIDERNVDADKRLESYVCKHLRKHYPGEYFVDWGFDECDIKQPHINVGWFKLVFNSPDDYVAFVLRFA